MQKMAQKRSIINKLREMTNVSGAAAEKFFNPQFQEVMDNLRSIDANIRSIATGQAIEGADPDPSGMGDTRSLKDLLKSAKSNFNRREYMTAVAELGRFHKKFADIVKQIANLNDKVNEVHHQFLFKDLDDEHKKQLHDLKNRWASQQNNLIKEANVMDFFYNIGTKRGRALAFYEKRYPKEIGKLKKDTANLLAKSESVLSNFLTSLKEMATARATRNVDTYMRAASKVSSVYDNYNNLFKDYYNSNVKGFLDKISMPTEKVEEKGLGKTEIPVTSKNIPDLDLPEKQIENEPIDLVNPKIPGPPRVPSNLGPPVPITPPPDTEPNLIPPNMESNPSLGHTMVGVAPQGNPPRQTLTGISEHDNDDNESSRATLPQVSSHKSFFKSLTSLSQENPVILASYIKKYAQSIQGSDPIMAIKLLQVVKSIAS